MDKVRGKSFLYLFIVALFAFLVVFAWDKLAFIAEVFKPLIYGVVIAYLLDGFVRFFNHKLKINRILSIVIVVVLMLVACGLVVYYAVPFLVDTIKDLITYVSTLLMQHNTGIYAIIETVAKYFDIDISAFYNFNIYEIDANLMDTLNNIIQRVYGLTVGTVTAIGSSLVLIITSVIMAIYMLIEKEDLLNRGRRLVRALVPERNEEYVLNSFTMANSVFKNFIIGKAIDSFIIGVLMFILFAVFRIEYAAVFSLIGGIGNMIPYFGPIFSSIPVVGILLLINPWHAVVALIIILVVQQLDGNVIGPKILSDNIGVSAFWILFAVTICGMAFGFGGMIVGVPLVVIIKNLVEDFVELRLSKRIKVQEVTEEQEEAEVVVEDAQEQ
ncbi:MAG: AI-2E family transporter [Clostridia bacterium]|nr:AI-2E family transporter [Clostridia bacterium]